MYIRRTWPRRWRIVGGREILPATQELRWFHKILLEETILLRRRSWHTRWLWVSYSWSPTSVARAMWPREEVDLQVRWRNYHMDAALVLGTSPQLDQIWPERIQQRDNCVRVSIRLECHPIRYESWRDMEDSEQGAAASRLPILRIRLLLIELRNDLQHKVSWIAPIWVRG